MHKLFSPFHQSKKLNTLFLANIFIAFHYALILYINSSFLNKFFSETQVSALYIIGAIMEIILLLNASKLIKKFGRHRFTTYAVTSELISLIGILVSTSPVLISLYFLIHIFSISLLVFNMDVFVEGASHDETMTGGIRAAYLTLGNTIFVFAPLVVGFLVRGNDYSYVYLLSAAFLLPLYPLIKHMKGITAPHIKDIHVRETITEYAKDKDLSNIFICQFLLQLFYSYMVVFVPLYLKNYIGFSWSEIGIIFTIMLLPFVLFELPVGEMEDAKYGEKEFLTVGFIIMGLSTIFISFVTVKIFWIWAAVLFISRVGATFVEVSTESYFFKHVNQDKTDIISFFRVSKPTSYVVAPILATISLQFIPFQYVFIVIGAIMVVGTHYSLALKDTK